MLIKCPECELQVSDKALSCPHCGYPLKQPAKRPYTRSKDHKRLPNGFGQISKLSNKNLRKPYRAMVTVGKNSKGRPICKIQGYYETYNDAYAGLVEYNKNPYDIDACVTIKELYEQWFAKYQEELKSKSGVRTITSAWAYCTSVYDMKAKDLRARHIKGCMDSCSSPNIKCRIKSLFNLMLDFGVEYEIVDKNYARTFTISDDIIKETEQIKNGHIAFNDGEMATLWANITINYVDVILIQCYMGWRPQELGLLKLSNVNLEEKWIIGGMKTPSGFNRKVPIHDKIYDLIKVRYEEAVELGSEYLINCVESQNGYNLTYDKYAKRFNKIMEVLGLNAEHRAHDPRKTFVTKCKNAGVDEYAIKYMAGHKIDDITEKVYTERKFEWLEKELSKLKE